MEAKIEL
jgi:hypothetical protein